jgi:hypothetical protein
MSKRRILPRKESTRLDPLDFVKKRKNTFSDQDTFLFTSYTVMDMPSGFPKGMSTSSYSFTSGERFSDLIAKNESEGIYVTGTVTWGRFDQFLTLDPLYSASADPFKESHSHDQNRQQETFFATGSSIRTGDGSFTSPLSNKIQVKKSFPVVTQTTMPAASSSLYYFDARTGQWTQPAPSIVSDPLKKLAFKTDVFTGNGTKGSFYIEDSIGFDPYGNFCASGSNNILRSGQGTKQSIDLSSYFENVNGVSETFSILEKTYDNNMTYSDEYKPPTANSNFEFTLDVTRPFLLEKAVIEIPFCMGPDWFNDKTTTCFVTGSGNDFMSGSSKSPETFRYFDSGGPGITVSMFCQRAFGRLGSNAVTNVTRELIFNSLLTHEADATKSYDLLVSGSNFYSLVANGIGNDAIGGRYAALVSSINTSFTGSVSVECTPKIETGLGSLLNLYFQGGTTDEVSKQIEELLSREYLDTNYISSNILEEISGQGFTVRTVNPLGKVKAGYAFSSVNSVFGRSMIYSDVVQTGVKNPVYIADEDERSSVIYSFEAEYTPGAYAGIVGYSFTGTSVESPHLVMPGDKLLLSVSKTRPAYKNLTGVDVSVGADSPIDYGRFTYTSSSYYNKLSKGKGHDVQLNTGSINMTFYGSYVSEDGEHR